MIIIPFVVLTLFITALYCLTWMFWNSIISKYKNFRFESTDLVFGHTLRYPLDPHGAINYGRSLWKKFGSKFIVWVGPKPLLICSDANWMEIFLKSPNYITKADFYTFLHDWLGTGLLTSTGAKWRKRRKLLTPAFHFSILKDFLSIFHEHALAFVDNLKVFAEDHEPIDIQAHAKLVTLDIICETAMGVKIAAQQSSHSEYVRAVLNMATQFYLRTRRPYLWPNFMMKLTKFGRDYLRDLDIVHSFTRNVILSRISQRSNSQQADEGRKVFLDILLDAYAKKEIDLDGIREEVDTFMFEGHDTTASALSWTLYLLSLNQDVQRKAQKEVDSVSTSENESLENIVAELKYLECVVKESLRMYPPVALYGRLLEQDAIVGNEVVPKGTNLMVATYGLHMDERYWSKPEEFNPDRFLEDEFLKRHPFQYLPFSAGPRNCIGQRFAMMEEKLILYHVLRNYSFSTSQSVDEVRLQEQLILHSSNGLWLRVHKRQSST